MARYYIDSRFAPHIKGALDEGIEAGFYTGEFGRLATSISRKLGETNTPNLSPEEYQFLRTYVSNLIVRE